MVRHENRKRAGDQEAECYVPPQHGPIHRETLGGCDPSLPASQLLPDRAYLLGGVTMLMAGAGLLVVPGMLHQACRVGEADEQAEYRYEHYAADPLARHELPAKQQIEDDTELGHQVRGGKDKG